MNRHMPRHPDWNAAIGRLQETCDKPMGLSAPETWRMEWSDRKSGGNWGKHGFVPWNFDKIHDFFGGFALNCSVQFSKTWPWLRNERRMLRIQLRRYALKCRKKPHGIQSMTIPFPVEWHWLSNICIYIDILTRTGKSPFFTGISTISMAIFHSFLSIYQRVVPWSIQP